MAKVIIDNTIKAGWLRFTYNDYFPATIDHKDQFQRGTNITAVDIIDVGGEECVEIMTSQSFPMYFTDDALSSYFMKVDTVNGAAPTSLTDLRDKILALL